MFWIHRHIQVELLLHNDSPDKAGGCLEMREPLKTAAVVLGAPVKH